MSKENFTRDLNVEATDECEDIRMWRFTYPYGGDIYIFMSCCQCSKKYLQRITNLNKVLEMTTVVTERLLKVSRASNVSSSLQESNCNLGN